MRARPGRSLLLAAGVAGATAMLVGVLGGGVVARDRAVQSALAAALGRRSELPRRLVRAARRVRATRSADRRVRDVLAPLSPRQPLAGTFFRQLVIDGGLVQLVSLDRLGRARAPALGPAASRVRARALRGAPGRGRGRRSSWRQDGIDLVRVGVAEVPDAAALWPLARARRARLRAARGRGGRVRPDPGARRLLPGPQLDRADRARARSTSGRSIGILAASRARRRRSRAAVRRVRAERPRRRAPRRARRRHGSRGGG